MIWHPLITKSFINCHIVSPSCTNLFSIRPILNSSVSATWPLAIPHQKAFKAAPHMWPKSWLSPFIIQYTPGLAGKTISEKSKKKLWSLFFFSSPHLESKNAFSLMGSATFVGWVHSLGFVCGLLCRKGAFQSTPRLARSRAHTKSERWQCSRAVSLWSSQQGTVFVFRCRNFTLN